MQKPQSGKDPLDIEVLKELLDKSLTLKKGTLYVLIILTSAFAAVISTVSSVYLTEKVSSYVIKDEFNESLKRLETTVKRTEKIQQEIKIEFSNTLESKNILRKKYEEVYLSTIEFIGQLEKETNLAINREFPLSDDSPKQKIIMLQSLYFPLLLNELNKLEVAHLNYQFYLLKLSESPEERFHEPKLAEEVSIRRYAVIEQVEEFRHALIEKYSKGLNL